MVMIHVVWLSALAIFADASTFSPDALRRHVATLASDEYEGRSPGTSGEEKTVAYIVSEFKRYALEPGNPDGTYIQRVPLIGLTSNSTTSFKAAEGEFTPEFGKEIVVGSRRFRSQVLVPDSELIFVGYGVEAPEFGWNDYKDIDLTGKTLVMLINDPPIVDPTDPAKLEVKLFGGKAMTYYGRWTYKYEMASAKKAAAAIIIHETGPAGYPWEVIPASFGRENMVIDRPDGNDARVAVEGWLSQPAAERLFALAGKDFAALKKAALSRDFRPVPLEITGKFRIDTTMRRVDSKNVLALKRGSDDKLASQFIVYTAHWDHIGRNSALAGDQIYNGALDNASGVAGLLALAEAAGKSVAPKRSLLFLSTTAEEKGLLGAQYYTENPLHPLKDTVAALNMDMLQPWGRARDFVAVGLGMTTLDEPLARVAKKRGRVMRADPEPEKGYFYRSDHFEFAKKGVPALFWGPGIDLIGQPEGRGLTKRRLYTTTAYHKVSDEINPDWDFAGMVDHIELLFELGLELARSAKTPGWHPGTEFETVRAASLKK
jgi:Zn-dependent M28 family amino/carboxypeptidase